MSVEDPHAVRVLVVEDHPLLRDGLVGAGDRVHGAVVGAATTLPGAAAREALSPDVVLLDHLLPDGVGAQAVPGSSPWPRRRRGDGDRERLGPRAADAVAGGAAGLVPKSYGGEGMFLAL